jgi:hypothetical protein
VSLRLIRLSSQGTKHKAQGTRRSRITEIFRGGREGEDGVGGRLNGEVPPKHEAGFAEDEDGDK